MILVDTSALIDSLTGPKRSASRLRSFIDQGDRLALPSLVLYEWWRGPRTEEDLRVQDALFPTDQALPFGVTEARIAARLYAQVGHPRGRELDLAIAACALARGARLWTLNVEDFDDIPGLELAEGR